VDTAFDPDKDRANVTKHGISLAEAARLDWDMIEARPDDSQDYGEERGGFAPYADGPLHAAVLRCSTMKRPA
jgi:uncharacterized protein